MNQNEIWTVVACLLVLYICYQRIIIMDLRSRINDRT